MSEFETEHNQESSNNIVIDGTTKQVSKGSRWRSIFHRRYSKHILFTLLFMAIGAGVVFVNASTTTVSLWNTSTIPKVLADSDTKSVELGVKFSSKYTGQVTGVRFYKSAQNTGTHTGTLWDKNGNVLATVKFSNETASGWQTANFLQPVTIAANVTYVISYHAPVGHYSADNNYFSKNSRTNGPLTAPRNTSGSPNGVYAYSSSTTFPTSTYQATNYWVDVVFTTGLIAPPVSAAPPTSVVATQSGSSIVVTWNAGSSSSSITGYKVYRNGSLLTTVGNVLTYTDTSLTAGTTYQYNVATVDSSGTSPRSVTSAVTYNVTPTPTPTCPTGYTGTPPNCVAPTTTPTPTPATSSVPGWLLTPSNTGLASVGLTSADLTPYTGSLNVSGRIYKQIINVGSGQLVLNTGAVIEDCLITGSGNRLVYFKGGTGQQIINSDLVGTGGQSAEVIGLYADSASGIRISGLRETGFTISAWIDGGAASAPMSTIDGWYAYGQPSGGTAHHDGFTRRAGNSPVTINNSRITTDQGSTTGAFFIQDTWNSPRAPGNVGHVTVTNSYLEGNGYNATLEISNTLNFTGNRFGPTGYGPVTTYNGPVSGLTWSDNWIYANNSANNYKGAAVSTP